MNNSTSGLSSNEVTNFIHESLEIKLFPAIASYILVFITALAANLILIIIVVKDRYMQNVTNYFLVNLSVADLLVTLICMPNAAWRAYTDVYSLGSASCKIFVYLQGISVASSIFTITTMAIDRYLAIIRPFGLRYRCFNRTSTIIMIFFLWALSLILFSPNLFIAGLVTIADNITLCRMVYNKSPIREDIIGIVWFIFMFAIPGCIMTIAYALMGKTLCSALPPFDNNESACTQQRNRLLRSRKRVACILLLLAFVFAVCWLPYHIATLLSTLTGYKPSESTIIYLLLLGHANSALNPIIYCVLSRNFRNSIRNLLKCKIRCTRKKKKNNPLNNWAADSSGSGFQFPNHQKAIPLLNQPSDYGISRRQSTSQKTRTCAV